MPNIDEAKRDETSPVWDMSQERVFIENLTNQRFNFFLIVFAFVVAGATNSKSYFFLISILLIGAIICTLLTLAILRINKKLHLILENLNKDNSHPIRIINDITPGQSVRWITGKAIPILCTTILWVFLTIALLKKELIFSSKSKQEIGFKIYNSKDSLCDTVKLFINKE